MKPLDAWRPDHGAVYFGQPPITNTFTGFPWRISLESNDKSAVGEFVKNSNTKTRNFAMLVWFCTVEAGTESPKSVYF